MTDFKICAFIGKGKKNWNIIEYSKMQELIETLVEKKGVNAFVYLGRNKFTNTCCQIVSKYKYNHPQIKLRKFDLVYKRNFEKFVLKYDVNFENTLQCLNKINDENLTKEFMEIHIIDMSDYIIFEDNIIKIAFKKHYANKGKKTFCKGK